MEIINENRTIDVTVINNEKETEITVENKVIDVSIEIPLQGNINVQNTTNVINNITNNYYSYLTFLQSDIC